MSSDVIFFAEAADVTGESLNAKNFAFKIKLIERTLVETGGNVAIIKTRPDFP
jgi:hypothetical protein